ncbi:MAG: S-ribosylhomocysteine lyase [Pantoea sp. Brub]|nr:S-ribosylhomocysteine lyase [Pantoea sp. Brub]
MSFVLDSFNIDHTLISAPSVRIAKIINTPLGDNVTIFDLRFCKPNLEILNECGMHTIEHLFAKFMRDQINSTEITIIDISPMGCRTGFYMSIIGILHEQNVISAWKNSMENVLTIQEQSQIKEINQYQCGNYKMHSLYEAKKIANNILLSNIQINYTQNLKLSLRKK